jgi:hypothetical protein
MAENHKDFARFSRFYATTFSENLVLTISGASPVIPELVTELTRLNQFLMDSA